MNTRIATEATGTRMRSEQNISELSGMCATCNGNCIGFCEIGLSAMRGAEALYPIAPDTNQYASEKKYPVDFSDFTINGRIFGACGAENDCEKTNFLSPKLECCLGGEQGILSRLPIILPAMAKLDWEDYFAGAALAGVPVVVGEAVISKDPGVEFDINGKVIKSPLLAEMVATFRKYSRGYGTIIVQANMDDQCLGVPEYCIRELGVECIELKFGQAAKGIQGMGVIRSRDKAKELKKTGYLIVPDPEMVDTAVYRKLGRLPMWTEETLLAQVRYLKETGAKQILFKCGGVDTRDIKTLLNIAGDAEVSLVTFDGAGGGTGNAPIHMMNEWGRPAPVLIKDICDILKERQKEGKPIPQIGIAGGFATEDQVFKALCLGAPYISFVGIGRAAMAAAVSGKNIGKCLESGIIPQQIKNHGERKQDVFAEYELLKEVWGEQVETISTGAIGLYSYLERVAIGLKQLMSLNRKFSLEYLGREDILPLTEEAEKLM